MSDGAEFVESGGFTVDRQLGAAHGMRMPREPKTLAAFGRTRSHGPR